ncbi:hypothetical protein DAEQUDRAFT_159381 [Daedalea quercina L-15889]|uniref:Uncharacterized protein n=1 Tax=Daedalea quercina L-15889 TaxID=1314783 RepID=A0A165KL16_9APHY|nr:hypothetical protein DAEQUDRAFT_159381 [Daedalea quercina L-15889]
MGYVSHGCLIHSSSTCGRQTCAYQSKSLRRRSLHDRVTVGDALVAKLDETNASEHSRSCSWKLYLQRITASSSCGSQSQSMPNPCRHQDSAFVPDHSQEDRASGTGIYICISSGHERRCVRVLRSVLLCLYGLKMRGPGRMDSDSRCRDMI